MFPIQYPQVWEMYKKAEASFWTGACANERVGGRHVERCAKFEIARRARERRANGTRD